MNVNDAMFRPISFAGDQDPPDAVARLIVFPLNWNETDSSSDTFGSRAKRLGSRCA